MIVNLIFRFVSWFWDDTECEQIAEDTMDEMLSEVQ